MASLAQRQIEIPAMTRSLEELLRATSRSFYLTLRVLPRAVRPQISLAYLLARTSDTIADAQILSLDQRLDGLRRFRSRLLEESATPLEFAVFAQEEMSAERQLLERADEIVSGMKSFSEPDQQLIRTVLTVIISGQELDLQRFGAPSGKGIVSALRTDAELDDYTYRVAGCVGEFWTKLCRAHLFPKAAIDDAQLLADGIRFGKGLQLVNILRDVPEDLRAGRCYLPAERLQPLGLQPETLLDASHEAAFLRLYREYLDRAQEHLDAAWCYTNTLPFWQLRVRLACAWPVLIGAATIAKLRVADVSQLRARLKVSRGEVRCIMTRSLLAVLLPFWWRRLYLGGAQ
jgi:farnesyl-diphosphate farnesyltransferase